MRIQLAFVEGKLDLAEELIVLAFVVANGSHVEAAKTIKVSDRQLRRWMRRLEGKGRDLREAARLRGCTINGPGGAGGTRSARV